MEWQPFQLEKAFAEDQSLFGSWQSSGAQILNIGQKKCSVARAWTTRRPRSVHSLHAGIIRKHSRFLTKERNVCGCIIGLTVAKDSDLLEQPNIDVKKVGAVKKGEKVASRDPWIQIGELGEGVINSEFDQANQLGLRPGDHFSIVQYDGEGAWMVCLGDQQHSLGSEEAMGDFDVLREPKTSNWVRIKTQQGVAGFAPAEILEENGGC